MFGRTCNAAESIGITIRYLSLNDLMHVHSVVLCGRAVGPNGRRRKEASVFHAQRSEHVLPEVSFEVTLVRSTICKSSDLLKLLRWSVGSYQAVRKEVFGGDVVEILCNSSNYVHEGDVTVLTRFSNSRFQFDHYLKSL